MLPIPITSIYRRIVKKRMVVKEINRKKNRLTWCLQKRRWTVNENWRHIIFSDESQIVIGQNNRVYVWRTAHEAYRPECMTAECVPKVSVVIWGCITWYGVGTLCQVNGNINAEKYISVLDSQLWPVIARHFPDDSYVFQDDNVLSIGLGLWSGISMITTFMVWYGQPSHLISMS